LSGPETEKFQGVDASVNNIHSKVRFSEHFAERGWQQWDRDINRMAVRRRRNAIEFLSDDRRGGSRCKGWTRTNVRVRDRPHGGESECLLVAVAKELMSGVGFRSWRSRPQRQACILPRLAQRGDTANQSKFGRPCSRPRLATSAFGYKWLV
jgi:hypothetical protein